MLVNLWSELVCASVHAVPLPGVILLSNVVRRLFVSCNSYARRIIPRESEPRVVDITPLAILRLQQEVKSPWCKLNCLGSIEVSSCGYTVQAAPGTVPPVRLAGTRLTRG